jgi:hypothetical protein
MKVFVKRHREYLHLRERRERRPQETAKRGILYVRCEIFTAVTMKNVVFWDIKTQFVPNTGHITSPLQSPAS